MRPKITRSDFLVKFFTGEVSVDDIDNLFHSYPYVYGAYTIIKPFDLDSTELVSATMSDEADSITLLMSTDKLAKKIKKEAETSYTFSGETEYPVDIKYHGKFVTLVFG